MTDEEIRAKIAEACGWQDVLATENGVIGFPPGFTEDQCPEGADEDVPNYPSDLNAMHSAEEHLTEFQIDQYLVHISNIVERAVRRAWKPSECNHWALANATARMKAEAFLRTLDKWQDVRATQSVDGPPPSGVR